MDLYDLFYFSEAVISGVLTGLMYSLVALGFVLIYKATDAINFAQGQFVMIGGMMIAGLTAQHGIPIVASFIIALVVMVFLCVVLERLVLRPMIGRPVVSIIMATIGLAIFLEGLFPLLFGSGTRALDIGIPNRPLVLLDEIFLSPITVVGGGIAIAFFAAFTWFFMKSRKGLAMRAVADSHTVSMAMGINVERYFVLSWSMAGVVAVLGGLLWGAAIGVDNQLASVGLKVFPVVILGGLDSIIGVIVGGIIVGIVESLGGTYLDPILGGGTKDFLPYVLMILVLYFRPQGLFGKKLIERV